MLFSYNTETKMLLIINIKDTDDIKLYRNGILYNIKYTREFNKSVGLVIIYDYINDHIFYDKYKELSYIQDKEKHIYIHKYINKSIYYISYYYYNKKSYGFVIKDINGDFTKAKINYFYFNNYKIKIKIVYVMI